MTYDYSVYKLASASSVMSATNWNNFWAKVRTDVNGLFQAMQNWTQGSGSYQKSMTIPEQAVATGNTLTATGWNAVVQALEDDIDAAARIVAGEVGNNPYPVNPNLGSNLNTISALGSKASGGTVTQTEWNNLVDAAQACIETISVAIDDSLDTAEEELSKWHFGEAMPIRLS
ncbi:MAG: hypothetical protein IJ588_08820 [Prevotella sp.]|nr:hypothetical protein [Prevotella sp.]